MAMQSTSVRCQLESSATTSSFRSIDSGILCCEGTLLTAVFNEGGPNDY